MHAIPPTRPVRRDLRDLKKSSLALFLRSNPFGYINHRRKIFNEKV
jgi:hypothetical protein